nr:hypothetical protein [Tanacetum cinerariifolium]
LPSGYWWGEDNGLRWDCLVAAGGGRVWGRVVAGFGTRLGQGNIVVDALSRISNGAKLDEMTYKKDKYELVDGILRRKGKIVVGNDSKLRSFITQHYHADAIGGHSGTHVTLHRIKEIFYCKGMQKTVKQAMRECDVCQREKPDLSAYPGLLQSFPIHKRIWSSISMDFIEKLPSSYGKTVILVVVDRLNKYAHFMALQHHFTASTVAQVFLDNVYRLYGMPESIMSDRDNIFLSNFWQSLFKILKVQLKMSTTYQSQTDGQTKIVNKCLECFLRRMTRERPKEWTLWLPMVEFWYNTNFHSAINTTSFQTGRVLVSGQVLPQKAQDRMISQANKHRSDRVYEVGMWVYLKLHPYRQVTIGNKHQHKLSSKYYGPFMIVERIRAAGILPHCGPNRVLSTEPVTILDIILAKLKNKAVPYVLVKWSNHVDEDATWENYVDFIQRYPEFEEQVLNDKLCLKENGFLQVKVYQGLKVQDLDVEGLLCNFS